ncbi:piwi-like protein Siwi [Anthonomus grandis grandis]|uniref:piwi-like protein Siwi n=1 Tax=Anthonomus grandis grandis TaxID=2921223 RepID=UPI0021667AF0|nr:piwi-like protein Siwi [Anthonomus grandis grandis]XP_050295936.1 piwi-like protein Siwi [Anthonomus grandis grandis]
MSSRGRAHGRARGTPVPGGQQQGAARPGGQSQQGPPQGGAWGNRAGGPPPQQGPSSQQGPPQFQGLPSAWSGGGRARQQPPSQQKQPTPPVSWGARPPAPEVPTQTVGRGSRQGGGDDRAVTGDVQQVVQGGDQGNLANKRGGGGNGVRGRQDRNQIINTKPQHIQTKKGVDGTSILVKANYFPLISATKWGLNQYRVDFNPNIEDTRTRKKLVAIGIRPFRVTGYLFDGTVLCTPNRLHPDPCEFTVKDEVTEQNVQVNIRMVGEIAWGDWTYLQLFNIIIRKCLAFMKFHLLGRNYFDPTLKATLHEHNLEIWPGFLTAMRQYENSIMLNVDLSFKVLRLDKVYDLLLECGQSRNPKQEFQQRVIGAIILTEYNNKTYRVDDVDFTQNPNSKFTKRDGSQISYVDYFQDRYHVRINHMDQPLLISRSKPREIRAGMPELVVLVPELCVMTGLTDKQRENFQLMKAMGEHTRVSAGDRMRKLLKFAKRLQACPEAVEEVRRWDLRLADNLVEIQARVMPQEPLLLRNNQPITGGDEADWTRNLRVAPMYSIVNIERLAIITPQRSYGEANEFSGILQKVGRGMSMTINSKIFSISDDRPQTYLAEIERLGGSMQPTMFMVILPNNSGDRYNAVKKKCYVDRAYPCQVMVARNLRSKGVMSIATKVAIQMNCKLGGAPWATTMPKRIMVCGYDVCRDTANKGKSFAGMVASMDAACSRYYSMTVEHEHEQELSTNIAAYMFMACKRYQNENQGALPDRIIIYRDGVGDGQIPYVKEHEVDLIKQKLAELYTDQPLKMAFIIVSKRINTKIFRSQAGPKNDFNPPPGTVVDDVITLPERYDFYLVSQCVRQGTVAPTSYNIIDDSLGIDANKIQRFTYKMCHMYYNWSGTVRVPAPCQYAHKLAFLTAQSLHRPASAALSDTLYYL